MGKFMRCHISHICNVLVKNNSKYRCMWYPICIILSHIIRMSSLYYGKCYKILNPSCLLERSTNRADPDQKQPNQGLPCLLFRKTDKRFMNFSSGNQHILFENRKRKVFKILEHLSQVRYIGYFHRPSSSASVRYLPVRIYISISPL